MFNLKEHESYRIVTGKDFFASARLPKLARCDPEELFRPEKEVYDALQDKSRSPDFMVLEIGFEGFKLLHYYSGKEEVPPIFLGPDDIISASKKEFTLEEAMYLLNTYHDTYYSSRN